MTKGFIRARRTVFLLPNAITTAALFCGFLAIVSASKGEFDKSVLFIVVAAIFDGLDGRVARLTNSQSAFGEVYDSLADMVSFGVAPAMLGYYWLLQDFNNFGSGAAFIYIAGAAMRLARFTAKVDGGSSLFFSGLPSPAAALSLASFVWLVIEYSLGQIWIEYAFLVLVALVGLLMVSNVRYYSFKRLPIPQKVSFSALAVPLLLIFSLIVVEPVVLMAVFFLGYALVVPVLYYSAKLFTTKKGKKKSALLSLEQNQATKTRLTAKNSKNSKNSKQKIK